MTFDDVRALALQLPGVEESTSYGTPALKVRRKVLVRLREPTVLVVMIDVADKEHLIRTQPRVYFETPHYDGWPAVLVRLDAVRPGELQRLLSASWNFVSGSGGAARRSRARRRPEAGTIRSAPTAARKPRR